MNAYEAVVICCPDTSPWHAQGEAGRERVQGTPQHQGFGFAAVFHPEMHGLGSVAAGCN